MRFRKVFLLANIIIISFILWVGFTLYRTWASTGAGTYQQSARINKNDAGKLSPRKVVADMSIFESVIKTDIFKTQKSSKGSPAQRTSPAAVKETDLDLELKGTMIDDAGERFAVILDGKTREQQTYVENDFVNGARIGKILADRVLLDRKGAQEALLMSYESGSAPARSPVARTTPRPRIVRVPPGGKDLNVERRPPTKKEPADEEGTNGP